MLSVWTKIAEYLCKSLGKSYMYIYIIIVFADLNILLIRLYLCCKFFYLSFITIKLFILIFLTIVVINIYLVTINVVPKSFFSDNINCHKFNFNDNCFMLSLKLNLVAIYIFPKNKISLQQFSH